MNLYGLKSSFTMLRAGVKPPKEYNHELSGWRIVAFWFIRVLKFGAYIGLGYLIYNGCNGK